jgi:hypothetical protein
VSAEVTSAASIGVLASGVGLSNHSGVESVDYPGDVSDVHVDRAREIAVQAPLCLADINDRHD